MTTTTETLPAAAATTAKTDDAPMWQKMGWNKPGRKGAGKKAPKAAKAGKAAKAPKAAKKAAKRAAKASKATKKPGRKPGRPAGKASSKVKAALAKNGVAVEGGDVQSLLVQAIKRAVDTGDYENARQILGLLEKQR